MSEQIAATRVAYAVYRTAVSGDQAVGTVINRVVWDGASGWAPPQGCAVIADPMALYPIGSVYSTMSTAATGS